MIDLRRHFQRVEYIWPQLFSRNLAVQGVLDSLAPRGRDHAGFNHLVDQRWGAPDKTGKGSLPARKLHCNVNFSIHESNRTPIMHNMSTTDSARELVHYSGMNNSSDKPKGEHWEFGKRVEEALTYAEINGSLRKISEELKKRGFDKGGSSFIGNVLRGEQLLSSARIMKLAEITGVNPVWLWTGDPPMLIGKTETHDIGDLDPEDQQAITRMIHNCRKAKAEKLDH